MVKEPPAWLAIYQQWLAAEPNSAAKRRHLETLVIKFEVLTDSCVKEVSIKYRLNAYDCDDLMQAGRLGVVAGIERFDFQIRESLPLYLKTSIHFKLKEELRRIRSESSRLRKPRKNASPVEDELMLRANPLALNPETLLIRQEFRIVPNESPPTKRNPRR